jgi:hypothetical protein
MFKVRLNVLFLLLFALSCSRYPGGVEQALTLAGDNRAELEQALEHYRNEPQKLAAAQFLIANMIGKNSLDTLSVAASQPYLDALAAYRKQHGSYGREGVYLVCDSIRALTGNAGQAVPRQIADLTRLSARFLITHIDRSFEVWQKYPWTARLGFDDFCNYVLPYRVTRTYWEETVPYFRDVYARLADSLATGSYVDVGKYINRDIQSDFKMDDLQNYAELSSITFRNMVEARLGECVDMSNVTISAMRSMGVPAILEMIPYWGNRSAPHFWTRMVGEPVRELYTNTQRSYTCPEDELINAMFWHKDDFTGTDGIPSWIHINSNRTVPKIYRERYAIQPASLACRAKEAIPAFFRNPGLEDVTARYMLCKDITVSLSRSQAKHTYLYLCCYDSEQIEWKPVDWAEVHRQKITFRNAGVNVLYAVACYQQGGMLPVGSPFLLTASGECKPFDVDKTVRDTTVLFSKFPYRTNVLYYATRMKGRTFQVANRPDLSDATDIYLIDKTPYYTQDVKITDAPPARYVLYTFKEPDAECISELEFWGPDETGREVKLEGKEIGNAGILINPLHNAFDGDRVSSFYNKVQDVPYIGLDFGKPQKITRIKYCPRSDDNGIVPGELYELYYWEEGWKSLGQQTGRDDYRLVYTNVPGNALLYIHNHTRGKEERPFTYENGKQVWW